MTVKALESMQRHAYFWETIGMRPDDSDISSFWMLIIEWSVLLDGQPQYILLSV